MKTVTLSLLVLRCGDLEASREFYERVGLDFAQERHGQGPLHYVATINGLVIELYPQRSDLKHRQNFSDLTRVGFTIDSLDSVIQGMSENGYEICSPPSQTPWGYQAIVLDPDGRTIELTEGQEMP